MLDVTSHGSPSGQPPLLIAHGLFGSARNWNVIAKRLSDRGQVLTVDMRNHGTSPHSDDHSYADLAEDLSQVLDSIDGPADVLGHSMGGKAAMMLALTAPKKLRRLIVADIAPVRYSHTQMHLIDAMQAVDLKEINRRSDADDLLKPLVEDAGIRAFLLQSVDVAGKRWRFNLAALRANMDAILGFPEVSAGFGNPTLFLSGGKSDYVLPEHRTQINNLFSNAKFAKIPDAQHWLHAEKPREFEAAVRVFLDTTS